MLVWLQSGKDCGNPAFRINHERGALNPHVFLAVHALFLEHAKLYGYSFVFVGQERIGEIVLFLKLLLGGGLIGGNSEHNCACPLDFLECVAEPARFNRSTGGVRLGIKEQDHVLSAIVF